VDVVSSGSGNSFESESLHVEGRQTDPWVIVDLGDVGVHLSIGSSRSLHALEMTMLKSLMAYGSRVPDVSFSRCSLIARTREYASECGNIVRDGRRRRRKRQAMHDAEQGGVGAVGEAATGDFDLRAITVDSLVASSTGRLRTSLRLLNPKFRLGAGGDPGANASAGAGMGPSVGHSHNLTAG
jgi:hypothetical protein